MHSEEEYTVAAAQQNNSNKQQNISNELSNHSGCRDVSTNDDDEADGNQLQIGAVMLDKSAATFTLA